MVDKDSGVGGGDTVNKQRDSNGKFLTGNKLGFKPNEVSNPKGRPPGIKYVSEYLREKLGNSETAEAVADALIAIATDPRMRGFVPGVQELLNRTEGKVPDTHKVELDVPVTIIFKPAEESNV